MSRPIVIAALSAASIVSSACTTTGVIFDDRPAANFRIGVTTPEDAIAALGPPTWDMTRPDGLRLIHWEYRRQVVIAPYQRRVHANFRDGRLVGLHAPHKDEAISLF